MISKAELKKNFAELIGADDDATLEEFYASYKDGVQNAAADMRRGIEAGDFMAIRAAAHSLKGIALTAGHEEAVQLAVDVSASAKQLQMEPIRALSARLDEMCGQL